MELKYIGNRDFRVIRSSDFPALEGGFEDLIWTQGETKEVPAAVGKKLLELHPNQFSSETNQLDLNLPDRPKKSK